MSGRRKILLLVVEEPKDWEGLLCLGSAANSRSSTPTSDVKVGHLIVSSVLYALAH